jgi:sialate O-acetylesterase
LVTPGERLAGWALAKTYGKDVPHLSPVRKSHRVDGDKIVIEFYNAAGGLVAGSKSQMEPVRLAPGDKIELFAIAGDDKRWHKASARIEGSSVIVSSPEVKQPVAVRYAFANNVDGVALYNRDLLPASPFRTDDWPMTTAPKKEAKP